MTLDQLFGLIPETQRIKLFFLDLSLEGTQESIYCAARGEIMTMTVTNVEAANDCLKIWAEDKVC